MSVASLALRWHSRPATSVGVQASKGDRRGTEPLLASPNVRQGKLAGLLAWAPTVLRASPADALEAALETNDIAALVLAEETLGEIARELVALDRVDASPRRPRQPAKARLTARQADNARLGVLEQAVALSARQAGWGWAEETTLRGREIVRLQLGFTSFFTRNFVRSHPIRSDAIRRIFAYWK